MKRLNYSEIARLTGNNKPIKTIIKNICSELVGEGCYRNVYILKQNPDYVVKIERNFSEGMFANATEWRNYINNRYWTFINSWLAPCELISETSQWLIQHRVYWDGKKRKDYPTHIPALFTDLKLKNFGWTKEDQFVCCDYSFLVPQVNTKNKYRYAKWWGSLK